MSWNELKLNSDGMIPVVVQDYKKSGSADGRLYEP